MRSNHSDEGGGRHAPLVIAQFLGRTCTYVYVRVVSGLFGWVGCRRKRNEPLSGKSESCVAYPNSTAVPGTAAGHAAATPVSPRSVSGGDGAIGLGDLVRARGRRGLASGLIGAQLVAVLALALWKIGLVPAPGAGPRKGAFSAQLATLVSIHAADRRA